MASPTDRRPDLYIALAIFLVSWITSALYLPAFRASGGHGEFYQDQFEPAVLGACGRGYVALAGATAPASLRAFLEQRADTFNCAELPPTISPAGLSTMQRAFRYLMWSASLVWRVRGVSWQAIDNVLSLLFASGLAGGYLALRNIAGRTLSIAGTLLWLGSPMHLGNLPHLRDYSKAPFFVLLLIAMAVVIRERRASRLVIAGALFGLAQGIGFGMRTDVILNFAPFLLVLFAAGARSLREDLPAELACAGVALVTFLVVGFPILGAYGGDDSQVLEDVAVLGLTTPFDEPLGIRPGPYDVGYVYNDTFVSAQIRGDWARSRLGTTSAPGSATPYATAAGTYYRKLAATFPGDFLTRMAGSIIQTLNLPFSITYGRAPAGATGVLARLFEWRTSLMLSLIGSGPLVAALLIFLIGAWRLRDGLVAVALLVFWTAYPFIQFHGRHTFHLEFLVIAGFVGLLSLAGRWARDIWNGNRPSLTQMARAMALVGGSLLLFILCTALARAIQTPAVRTLLAGYEHAAADPIATGARVFEPPNGQARLQQALIAVESACVEPAQVTVRYDPLKDQDFTRPLQLAPKTRVFIPVYAMDLADGRSSRFSRVEGPGCVSVARVRGVDHLLWIDATLTPGWAARPLYQRVYIGTALPERLWLKIAHWWPSFATLG